MNHESQDRKARIAKIKRYKQLKRLQQCRRKTRLNIVAAKMLTYASVPVLSLSPSLDNGSLAEARGYNNEETIIATDKVVDIKHLQTVALNNYDISTAVNNIVANDGAEFLAQLNRRFSDISSRPKGRERKAYTSELYGNINYCNMAVVQTLKDTDTDYLADFLNNLQNPALCQSFIKYIKQTHPDCIRYADDISRTELKKGDILVMNVSRRNQSSAITSSGKHTVTYDGEDLISFNSESRYKPSHESGHIINMDKIREKELRRKLQTMSKTEAVFYLISLENKTQLAQSKTKVLSPQILAQNVSIGGR